MENSANIMRVALIVSIMLHVLFMLFSGHELRATTHGEVMDVEIVPANEMPAPVNEPKADPDPASSNEPKADTASVPSKPQEPEAKPEKQSSESTAERPQQGALQADATKPSQVPPPASAPRGANQQPPKPAEQATSRASDQKPSPQSDQTGTQPQSPGGQTMSARDMAPDRLAAILGLPADQPVAPAPGGFGRASERMSKLTEGVKQLTKCLVLPPGVARTDQIKMIIRVELTRDGALATDPTVIDGAAPAIGYPMMLSAIRALRQCAPYRLPADKYADWKMLELDFSPDEMLDN
jgi:hypothetical protein